MTTETGDTADTSRKSLDFVRVLRVVEYVGPRYLVEEQVARSLHGTRRVREKDDGGFTITATTVGEFPETLRAVHSLPPLLVCGDCGHRTYDDLDDCPRCGASFGDRGSEERSQEGGA